MRVQGLVKTCWACPAQWEAVDADDSWAREMEIPRGDGYMETDEMVGLLGLEVLG